MYTIVKGGYYTRHEKGFLMDRPYGIDHYLLLLIRTSSSICINHKIQKCKPDSILLIRPHTPYSYSNPGDVYIDDWVHFDGTIEDFSSFPDDIFETAFPISSNGLLTTYIQQILWEHQFSAASYRQTHVDYLMQILMDHILHEYKEKVARTYSPYHYKMQQLHIKMQASPELKYTASEIASSMGISLSYFQHLYKKQWGTSFQADLISMRIDYARELISQTDIPFEQIALACGYSNEVHFYRQFQAKTGMTPGAYRQFTSS